MQAIPVTPGERFGRLTVIKEAPRLAPTPSQRASHHLAGDRTVECRCDCGTVATVRLAKLRHGRTRSCGCLFRETAASIGRRPSRQKHGLCKHPLYGTWATMMKRCYNPKQPKWRNYGARGIKVCARWHDIRHFLDDISRDLGPRPRSCSIDRINNDGDYEPGNVRWATAAQQGRNRRGNRYLTAFGRTMPIVDWARELGVHPTTLQRRLRAGWSAERAVSTPSQKTR